MKNLLTIILYVVLQTTVLAQTSPVPDPAFLNYLRTYFPQVIDQNDQLIIDEAAQITSPVSCAECGIKNVEGLQYFTAINTIYLRGNNITSIPDISGLKNLEALNLSENELSTLPPLSGLTNLKKLIIYSNQLSTIPDLTNNTLLTDIVVYYNQLTSIPDISSLINLALLEVGGNKISSLPDLSNCKNLEQLLVWGNQLTSLPSLTANTKLRVLNAGANILTVTPDLSANIALEEVILDKNMLTEAPDLSNQPLLKHVILERNKLTFEDLYQYISYPGYEIIFSVAPQEIVTIGVHKQVYEGDSVAFSTQTDTNVPDITYSWFFNNNLISKSQEDSFLKIFNSSSDQGYYYATITNPAFPNLIIQTDSFYIEVLPCLNLSSITVESTEINCLNTGTAAITYSGTPSPALYILKSTTSGKELKSETGNFTGLTEPEYLLTIETENCKKTNPSIITISRKECKETFITPDNDGQNDTVFFDQYGEVVIYDKSGRRVRKLQIPAEWDGTTVTGTLLQPGYYVSEINEGQEFINISIIY